MTKRALLTGITGQDGSFLAELLLEKGYEVYGLVRRASTFNTNRIEHLDGKIKLYFSDLADTGSVDNLVSCIQPDELYALGAQSHVRISFDVPEYTGDITGLGTLRLLEAVRKTSPHTRFYQAGSSEQFGSALPPQNENTLFQPESPYAIAKVYSFYMTKLYRKAYKLFATNGMLFNHESERRGNTFVTRKITKAAARIKLGLQDKLYLGNLDSCRDWGYAKDYVRAMWMMLQHDTPDDFVVATGETHSVREFLEAAFDKLGLDPYKYVVIDEKLFRPSEVNCLLGDASKIKNTLGWEPQVTFKDLVSLMVEHDLDKAKKDKNVGVMMYENDNT